jgi:hypothetical protein
MAKKNIDEYTRVLTILESGTYIDKDGFIMLADIEDVFKALSDKTRSETIRPHITTMCRLKLLQKKGEISYKISENWRDTVKLFK